MDVPLHEDFLEGPPPPPHHSNFSYLQVKGVDMRIVMPKRSDTEEALVIFVGKLSVENERMDDGIHGRNNVEYVRYFVHLEDVEISYRGLERLLANRAAAGYAKRSSEIRSTETNAVVLGAEDGLIALVDAEELQIQFDDLITKYDRPRAEVVMGVLIKGQNITASLPEKAQKAMDSILQANANEISKLIKLFKFNPPPKSNMNIRFGAPFVEVQAHQVHDPCPVYYDQGHNLVYGIESDRNNKNEATAEGRRVNRGFTNFELRQNLEFTQKTIASSLSTLTRMSKMSNRMEEMGTKLQIDAGKFEKLTAPDFRYSQGTDSTYDIIEEEIFDLHSAMATIRKLRLEKAEISRKAEEDKYKHMQTQAMLGNHLREVSSKLSGTVRSATNQLSKVQELLENNVIRGLGVMGSESDDDMASMAGSTAGDHLQSWKEMF
jgi:hypothetical protein